MFKFFCLSAGLVLITGLAPGATGAPAAHPGGIARYEIVEIAPLARTAAPVVRIEAFGRTRLLVLEDHRRLLANLPEAQRRRATGASNRFLKGRIQGQPDSWVRLALIDGRLSGGFFDGEELFLIEPAAALAAFLRSPPESLQAMLIFRFSDLSLPSLTGHDPIDPAAETGAATSTATYSEFAEHLAEVAQLDQAMLELPVTIVSDVQFSTTHGANAAAVVAGRTNFVDGIYSSQAGVGIGLYHHEILADNGPLTETHAVKLLTDQFRPFMSNGAGLDIPFAGLAHLFSGRDFDGNTVGVAYKNTVCNRWYGYGVNQSLTSDTISALVFAHELGHNFNAPHDGQDECSGETFRGIMSSSINGSEQFSACSLEQMSAPIAHASCLVEVESESEPDDVIFRDGFGS